RELVEPRRVDQLGEALDIASRDLDSPQCRLDRDLPDAGGADERRGDRRDDRGADLLREAPVIGEEPEEDLRVEERPHQRPAKARRTPAGSGASKSAAMRIRPFSRPGRRLAGESGTRRARGRPARAITISSPAAARSTRREKCVLAAWMLTTVGMD